MSSDRGADVERALRHVQLAAGTGPALHGTVAAAAVSPARADAALRALDIVHHCSHTLRHLRRKHTLPTPHYCLCSVT